MNHRIISKNNSAFSSRNIFGKNFVKIAVTWSSLSKQEFNPVRKLVLSRKSLLSSYLLVATLSRAFPSKLFVQAVNRMALRPASALRVCYL